MRKTLLCATVILLSCGFVVGQTQYKVLWNFGSPNDGATPLSNLVFDRVGNLYGTTKTGGVTSFCTGCGTVFRLSPNSDGTWSEDVLYNFCSILGSSSCLDGALPKAGLILDAKGNLYGTTSTGGSQCLINVCGIVFELSPPTSPGGQWAETVLYNFCANSTKSCPDGAQPTSGLAMDVSGNLYGTTTLGGSGHDRDNVGGGIVFELSHEAGGWAETVLYNFCTVGQSNVCLDGSSPQAGVTFDKAGNLYGTTIAGGDFQGRGTVYKLSPGANGWTETVLRTSKQSLAGGPLGTVSIDPLGNLYSTFSAGGQRPSVGGVFRLGPHGGGIEFSFNESNGSMPSAGLLLDSKHPALYGTTFVGGTNQFGTVFKIVAPAEETVLYSFCGEANCIDGAKPAASLVEDQLGNLYGTAMAGGANNQGVVFEIVQSLPKKKAVQRPAVWHTMLPSKK